MSWLISTQNQEDLYGISHLDVDMLIQMFYLLFLN